MTRLVLSRAIPAAALLAISAGALLAAMPAAPTPIAAPISATVTSKMFTGVKANKGTVTLATQGGVSTLTLSDDFVTPDTPAPHWRLVDSGGNTYLLQRLKTKDKNDNGNRSITVPDYIHDIAKVQIYCAWAEVVLGETTFNGVQQLQTDSTHAVHSGPHISGKFSGVKANTGTVTHAIKDGKSVLTLSSDFVTPDTPAPHWRLVDSEGRTYLLESLKTKADGSSGNRSIVVPAYIPDIAKVQVYCAWAEVVLGEATFAAPVH
jgi:hypothetical protein